MLGDLYSYIEYFEYAGIFFVSFFAGIITVIPIPVVPFLALAALNEQMNPQLVVLSVQLLQRRLFTGVAIIGEYF